MIAVQKHHAQMALDLQTELALMRIRDRARRLQAKADIDWRMLLVMLRYRQRGIR